MKPTDIDSEAAYTKALKIQIAKSTDVGGVSFHHLTGWKFSDSPETELVLIGDFPPVLSKAKKVCGNPKAIGLCKLEDGDLKIEVKSGKLETSKLIKAFRAFKLKTFPLEVPKMEVADAEAKESRAKTMEDVDATAKKAALVTGKTLDAAMASIKELMEARVAGLAWQKLEMKVLEKAHDRIDQLKAKYDTDTARLDKAIADAKAKAKDLKEKIAEIKSDKDLAQKTKDIQIAKLDKTLAGIAPLIAKAEADKGKLEDKFKASALVQKVDASKHGTGRHGAQAGVEQQARRAATGGMTADQDEVPHGTSGGDTSTKWQGLTVEWDNVLSPTGEVIGRKLKDEAAVKKLVRWCDTKTSSNFLSPELEMEAAKRAIEVAKQVEWDEVRDGPTDDWKPLDRIFLQIDAPRTNKRFKGWGMSATYSGEPKSISDALDAVSQFTDGKIDTPTLLKKLNVTMLEKDGGAIILPHAQVMLDRKGKNWVNTSQYPIDLPVGWDIAGKLVRKKGDTGVGIRAPGLKGL